MARAAAGVLLLGLAGCAVPATDWWRQVAAAGFQATVVGGDPFRHVVLDKPGRPSGVLHVYLDGDGTPWEGTRPAADPTPRNPLVLELMRLDPEPSVYLGRPCYHGLAGDAGCEPALWTDARYSERVVGSMTAALRAHPAARAVDRLTLIGYSGGGALAMLLAPRLRRTVAVVTVAGNLDTDAWTAHHRYRRLSGSLNPAAQAPLPPRIHQRHYVGVRDLVVPPRIAARGPFEASTVVTVPDFDHVCCWARLWPSVLEELVRATALQCGR